MQNEFEINNGMMKFYNTIISKSPDELISLIKEIYTDIKGFYGTAPCMGEYGSFEFAGVLLLWKYLKNNLYKDKQRYGELQIILGDLIGCSFFGMPALEWSDKLDKILYEHSFILSYQEWNMVYNYLKNNLYNEIHLLEFNKGNTTEEIYSILYQRFINIYNSTDQYSDMINYYTSKGLRIKKYIPYHIIG